MRYLRNAYTYRILDASDKILGKRVKDLVLKNDNVDYESCADSLQKSLIDSLSDLDSDYVLILFDDLLIYKLTDDFIKASIKLLNKYKPLNCIFFDLCDPEIVNDKVILRLSNSDSYKRKKKWLTQDKIDGYNFNIYYTYRHRYPFFLNSAIVDRKKYIKKLLWYYNNISENNPHAVEMAAADYKGPGFLYIAIPEDVLKVDIDFNRSAITSNRPYDPNAKILYNKLSQNLNEDRLTIDL